MSRIKQIRMEQGLRQLDLAKLANVSISWLWALENSFSQRVSRDIKMRVAKALGHEYEELFPEG
jgi:transcriptional regulator with XRE-family HTH domain